MTREKAPVQGAQVVTRVSRILRVVSEHGTNGISTAEIVRHTGLTRPTVHRLLSSLAAEGFLDHDARGSLWHLGPELYLMGALVAARYDVVDAARASVQTLARETGESAFFSARRGDETVCLLREEGSFPVRSFVLYEGVRFPLGVASAGLAILSYLPNREVVEYLDRNDLEARWGPAHAGREVRARVSETRARGYAVNPGLILEGSWGMGAAVFDRTGAPAWALSLTGIEARFRPERHAELGAILLAEAHTVTKRLQAAALVPAVTG